MVDRSDAGENAKRRHKSDSGVDELDGALQRSGHGVRECANALFSARDVRECAELRRKQGMRGADGNRNLQDVASGGNGLCDDVVLG